MLKSEVDEIVRKIKLETNENQIEILNYIKQKLHEESPSELKVNPVNFIRWVKLEKVCPNDYNPNSVAPKELSLLAKSILQDGYTQPVVTFYDSENDKYIIVDGFHRYFSCKNNKEINQRNNGYLPVVVIEKSLKDRMASTVRHNRARGKHSINGMSNIVFEMLDNGARDADICNELGMEAEELLKLKHITGFSKLFENVEYKKSWVTKNQILIKKQYEAQKNSSTDAS